MRKSKSARLALALALVLVPPATARADMLSGGLLASLFRGETFTGPRLVDILILGLVVFVLLRLIAGRAKPRSPDTTRRPDPDFDRSRDIPNPPPANKPDMYTMAQATWDALKSPNSKRPANGPTIDVSPDAPPDEQFLAGAKMAYSRIVTSLAERDLDDLAQFVSPAYLAQLKNQLPATPAGRPDILLVDAAVAESREENGHTIMVVDYKTLLREPGASQNTERRERWRFSRDNAVPGANWLLENMERR